MPNLSEKELRTVTYYAIGVGTEGTDVAYQLSFCGHNTHQPGVLKPIGNSGYTIGEMQVDLGANARAATELVDSFEEWARTNHPDWMLKDNKTQFASDLARDGYHIRDPNYEANNAKYKHDHHGRPIPSDRLPATGQDIEPTFKAHLNSYLASDAGKRFVHQQDIGQVGDLVRNVGERLSGFDLYKSASREDQAKIFAVVGKTYNQGPSYANRIMDGIEAGDIRSFDDISKKIDTFPDYMRTGRDAALKGAELFNALQNASERNPMRDPWQAVVANPLVDPTALRQDARQPHLPEQYATVKGAFVQPEQGRALVGALENGGSYNYGDPTNDRSRGFYAEGKDFMQWDRDGQGRAFVNGQWSEFSRSELSLAYNKDHTLDVHIARGGQIQNLLHVTHPTESSHAFAQAHREVLRQGMHGDDVQKLQTQLGELGYLDGTPDGKFGPATRDAVKTFQHDHHLPELGRASPSTQKAIQVDLQPLRRDDPGLLPAVSAMSGLRTGTPDLDDPRNPLHRDHALFNELKERIPDASENRLLQFTAACHGYGINERNLQKIHFDEQRGFVTFASGGLMPGLVSVDVKQPSPQPEQSIQHIRQFDQQQALNQAQFQAQQAQINQQQGPTFGGR